MKDVFGFFRNFHREAAWEGARNVFAVLGVGATLANIATMRIWLMAPAVALVVMTWYGFYKLYDVPLPARTLDTSANAGNQPPDIVPRPAQAHTAPDPAQAYRPAFAGIPAAANANYPRVG